MNNLPHNIKMDHDGFSTLLLGRLTRILDLNYLEELKVLEECGYVRKNMELEINDNIDLCFFYENQENNLTNTPSKNSFLKSFTRKEVCQEDSILIPRRKLQVLNYLIDYLRSDVGAEGLFRVSGNKKRQQELKSLIEKEWNIDVGVINYPCNTHDIAGILKEYIGQLKEPLFTRQLYDCYLQLSIRFKDMPLGIVHERKLEALKALFLLLPPLNRYLLKKLIGLLAVVAHNPNNRMDANNLSVVFAPNICTREIVGSTEFTNKIELFTELIKFMIENFSEVFKIPEEFLREVEHYQKKLTLKEVNNGDVPMTHTYCRQIDPKDYKKEALINTNEAIGTLYQQIQNMNDGPRKKDFLTKFHDSYPGTPVFVPKSNNYSLSSPGKNLFGTPTQSGNCSTPPPPSSSSKSWNDNPLFQSPFSKEFRSPFSSKFSYSPNNGKK